MGRLKSYLWRYWRRYLIGAFYLFGTATLIMWIPWWIREGVRIIEDGGPIEDVTFYVLLIIGAAVVQGITRTSNTICAMIFSPTCKSSRSPFISRRGPGT